jgi:CHASE2 domain-containing sensor protein
VRRLQEERRKLQEERLLLEGERKRRNRVRVASVAVAFALFFAAIGQLFDFIGLDERVAVVTMLLARIGAPEPPWSGEVVLVGIDEETERKIGRKFDPDWRAEHAVVIANAASAAARTIAFDMVLEDPASEAANAALEQALAATREKMSVVFAVQTASRDGKSFGAMLAPFAKHARQGVGCLSLEGGQAIAVPLVVVREAAADPAPAASGSAGGAGTPGGDLRVPAFGLAAYTGGAGVQLIDEAANNVVVRLRRQGRAQEIDFYKARTLGGPQPGCEVLQPGDRVLRQLLDPYALPALRSPPQRIAYERVVAGDPTALALLKNRVVLVGTLLPGRDRQPLPWPADDRWGVELFAAQIDAMARDHAIQRIPPVLEWALMTGAALLGAVCGHRLRERRRAVRLAALAAIALAMVVAAVACYRFGDQLVGVTYDLAALALGAWLANRISRRPSA